MSFPRTTYFRRGDRWSLRSGTVLEGREGGLQMSHLEARCRRFARKSRAAGEATTPLIKRR
jgi:hypothetical protein